MKKTIVVVMLIILIAAAVFFITRRPASLPVSKLPPPAPAPVSTPNAPKTFDFDSSIDLRQELDKINPQVLDSDFD